MTEDPEEDQSLEEDRERSESPISLSASISSRYLILTNRRYFIKIILVNQQETRYPGTDRELLIDLRLERIDNGNRISATDCIDLPDPGHIHIEAIPPNEDLIVSYPVVIPKEGDYKLSATCHEIVIETSNGDIEYEEHHKAPKGLDFGLCSTSEWKIRYKTTNIQTTAPQYDFFCRSKRKALGTIGVIAGILGAVLAYFQFFVGIIL